jgi:pimeloyl-ACP methyl ester carboxylesterase
MTTRVPDYQVTGSGRVTVFLLHGIYGSKEYWRYATERNVFFGHSMGGQITPRIRLKVPDLVLRCSVNAEPCPFTIHAIEGEVVGGRGLEPVTPAV